ncbi:MAG TPA: hypothetical protein VEJ18_03870 [Planctomycetota bacterium]|nr:hypothetical protein [Planctomycetota bacterium]
MDSLESARLSFHGLLPVWAAVAIGVVAGAGAIVLYWKERGKLGVGRRAVLALLRVGVIGTALFLLLRPVLITETKLHRPRGVAVLLDNSLSLTQRDHRLTAQDRLRVAIAENAVPLDTRVPADGPIADLPAGVSENPSRSALVKAVLAHPKLQLLPSLAKVGPMRVWLAGQRARALETPAAAAEALKNEETRTAVADAVRDVLHAGDGDLPSALVVVTDGQDNASRLTLEEAGEEAARLGVPVHVYGVGASDVGNLELKDFLAPETIVYDDLVSVPVRWRCRGFKQGSAEIVLQLGGRVVATKEVALQDGEELRDVLTFTPRNTGQGQEKSELQVLLRRRGEEAFTDDNSLKKPVSVVDRKVKILYVEGAPRWEYKFLQVALLRDRRVEPKFFLAGGDRRTLNSGGPYLPSFPPTRSELFGFDLLILGDVAPAALGADKAAWVRDFVREGGSLIVLAGRQAMPGAWHGTALAEALPIEFAPTRTSVNDQERTQTFVPVLTRAGERSEMFMLADTPEESARVWPSLPGFHWVFPASRLRPGAQALTVHPRLRAGDQPMPVFAIQHYGKGQVLFLGTDETWRWRQNDGEKRHGRFWGQILYQMGLPHLVGTPKRVQLSLERPENVLGRPGHVYARVFDAEFRPYAAEKIVARLDRVDAKVGEERQRAVLLEAVPGQPGEYRALLAHDATGTYSLRVEDPAPASLEFRVGLPPEHELQAAGLAEDALRAMATASGGAFYREEDLHRLVGAIAPKTAVHVLRHERLLWNAPVFLLFLGLIAAEWILRKFSNLS